jgi:hypothetical protein
MCLSSDFVTPVAKGERPTNTFINTLLRRRSGVCVGNVWVVSGGLEQDGDNKCAGGRT